MGTIATALFAFDADPVDAPPTGFLFAQTGGGKPARWLVRAAADAPSGPHVLAQVDTDRTRGRFPMAIVEAPVLADVSVSVRCKPVAGDVDQACGLVARYRDPDNYYIARANALEDNVRLYTVVEGKRRQIAGFDGRIPAGRWHLLRLDVRGDHLEVYWNGERVIDHRDRTFTAAGRVGMWTKADSVSFFDDLRIEPL